MPRMYVELDFDAPASVTRAELRDYIITELRAAGGLRDPIDPLFGGLRVVSVKFKELSYVAAHPRPTAVAKPPTESRRR